MASLINKYLTLLQHNIDRKSLILIASKLKISGYTNKFGRPYIKKNDLKTLILTELKRRGLKRSKSLNNLNNNNQHAGRKRSYSTGSINISKSPFSPCNYIADKCNTLILPKVHRLIAIGDIHGDMRAIVRSLKVANVIPHNIPENNSIDVQNVPWTGGSTVIVQLGDQIDRARPTSWSNDCIDKQIPNDEGCDLKIMNLLDNLNIKAKKVGGAVISILGNHELMNVDGDFRYVSLNEFAEFGLAMSGEKTDDDLPYGYKERQSAFAPGGIIAKRMAETRYCVVQVGSWLFVHGGITPKLVLKYNLDHLNYYTKQWLKGNNSPAILDAMDDIFHNDDSDYSPYWSRIYSDYDDWNEARIKYLFNNTLKILNSKNKGNHIKGMIMGHSPQYMWDKGINSSFDNRLWRVDVGMSRAFGPLHKNRECRKIQVLEIINDNQYTILTEA